ncbi:MAG TPA: DUF3566 domain-containing protein [Acidimicrobiia bacterium]|nr:DUF3566 domain-containing protein [Acidimicrobiia bacterium]
MTRIDTTKTNGNGNHAGNGNGAVRAKRPARLEPVVVPETERVRVTYVNVGSVARVAMRLWSLAGASALGVIIVLWTLLRASGGLARFEHFIDDATGLQHFHVMSIPVLIIVSLFIALLVVIAMVLTIATATAYNVLARSKGGIEVKFRHVHD